MFKFKSYRLAAAEISRLETALGIPSSRPIFNVSKAAERIGELESMLEKTIAAKAAATQPSTTPPTVENAKKELTGRDRFVAATNAKPQIRAGKNVSGLTGRARFVAASNQNNL